jgi:uncharacterized membrane protein YwaF
LWIASHGYWLIPPRFDALTSLPLQMSHFTSLIALAVVLPVNLQLGANHGFLGKSTTLHPGIVDLLGPWPQRLLITVPLAAVAMWLALLPWLALAKRRATFPSPAPTRH